MIRIFADFLPKNNINQKMMERHPKRAGEENDTVILEFFTQ